MKKIFGFFAFLALIGCNQTGNKNDSNSQAETTPVKCEVSVPCGDIDLCLPKLAGMTECFANPKVQERALNLINPDTEGLACYLPDSVVSLVATNPEWRVDNFAIITTGAALKSVKVGTAELNQIADAMVKNNLRENWDILKKKIETNSNYLSVGKPIILEAYSPAEQVRTFVMMLRYQRDGVESVLVMTANILLIKDRLINLGYYKNYDSDESITKVKATTNEIVLKLIEENM